ncbi:hypothetical protein ABMA28_003723 [Loxostege sticticalis]|uniref:Uncharacterized protein n=1 Tax=Loxostege sticticalis TaxID=481309 RepID=A0ABD0STD7_LOXSC
MDYTIPILLLSLCACVYSEPLPDALQRRSDRGVYASDYSRDYEPYAFAAIPLHSPIPVLHVLSHVPNDQHRAQSINRPTYALPQFAPNRYGQPNRYEEPTRYGQPHRYASPYPYAASMSYVMYTNPPETEESAPTILYARPNPSGGYTYRRRPNKNRTPPKRPPNEPVIIKIHKYRIIRDR